MVYIIEEAGQAGRKKVHRGAEILEKQVKKKKSE